MRCWCGYLSVAMCRLFAYGPADATAVPEPHQRLPHLKYRLILPFWYQVVLEKKPFNGSSSSSSSYKTYKMCVCCIITGASALCESAVPQCRRLLRTLRLWVTTPARRAIRQPSRRLRTHHNPPIHLSSRIRIRRNLLSHSQVSTRDRFSIRIGCGSGGGAGVVICYLSGARCRLAYGPADAAATHCILLR